MTAVPTWSTGREPSPDEFTFITDVRRYRAADQSKSDTTLIDDDTFTFTPDLNTVWAIDIHLMYSAGTTGDLKYSYTWPAGAAFPHSKLGYTTALAFEAVAFNTPASGDVYAAGGNGGGAILVARVSGVLTMATTAGSWKFRFAQNATDAATATTLRKGSWMRAMRLG